MGLGCCVLLFLFINERCLKYCDSIEVSQRGRGTLIQSVIYAIFIVVIVS